MQEQYQLLPSLGEEEFAALKADIAERGVMVPVELDEAGNVLDGHHRLQACAELGIVEYPTIIRQGMTEDEKREHVLALNLDRRHLDKEQRDALAVRLRSDGMSLRDIAEKLKTGLGTVHRAVAEGVPNGTPDGVVTGQDGKTYPAHRPAPIMAPTRQEAVDLFNEQEDDGEPDAHEFEEEFVPTPEPPRAHVANNSGENEWYTPEEYIEAARAVMGGIDLDPASCEAANEVVKADHFFTIADDGLAQKWHGRVWLNPPYGSDTIGRFAEKVVAELGNVEQAVVLVNNATETQWFQALGEHAAAVCFLKGRIRFWAPGRPSLAPLQGQAVLYFGDNANRFAEVFGALGLVWK